MSPKEQLALCTEAAETLCGVPDACALESEVFPIDLISQLAEQESWRKEVNRPIYHVHKWWAKRLGSVFRAIVLGAFAPKDADIASLFYSRTRIKGVVFDPFMGSGTTLGESLKLGANAIGRDINPIAYFLVRNALAKHPKQRVLKEFEKLEFAVSKKLQKIFDPHDEKVLYYFWVMQARCVHCERPNDLFSNYVFSRHAYPKKYPDSQILCPNCGTVNQDKFDSQKTTCRSCQHTFNPQIGPVSSNGRIVNCVHCHNEFGLLQSIDTFGGPPIYRQYAKMLFDAERKYTRTTENDELNYLLALKKLESESNLILPDGEISSGANTNQVLRYGFSNWSMLFNARQLLSIGLLSKAIAQIEDDAIRQLFFCLLSGTLEFNNKLNSFKGEGTGAVRHMFSHHILKPSRTPIEGSIWGTPRSSGSFSTLFKSRILRALEYAEEPFELFMEGSRKARKIYGLSEQIGFENVGHEPSHTRLTLTCGDSSATDLPDNSVDAIVTDPPFFDNVNYSELADFFFSYLRHACPELNEFRTLTTRSSKEVQHGDEKEFSRRLAGVFRECRRVLKDGGIFAFTYHHSRTEGWLGVKSAVEAAGFRIVASQPVKSELAVATPKSQSKSPINLDVILVCRKEKTHLAHYSGELAPPKEVAIYQARKLATAGFSLTEGDIRVICMGQLLRHASCSQKNSLSNEEVDELVSSVSAVIKKK